MSDLHDDDFDELDDLIRAVAHTPEVTPFPGTERYRVRRCLGEGGFGVVYEVEDRELGRPVALKTFKPGRGGISDNIRRLKNEFRAVADLVHPNLVGLHELSTDGSRWFFTMDLVRGCDFLEYVGDDETRLRLALAQLVAGVRRLHEAGIVHRDLKPSNVLVERDGRVVILDFGLAASESPRDQELRGAGTPAYMAPEQISGAAVTPAADWYAVGVMLYEALTGALPFETNSPAKLAYTKLTREVPSAPGPTDLRELCSSLLRIEPKARPTYDTIIEMLGEAAQPAAVDAAREGVFVGRAHELGVLRHAYADVRAGRATLVRIAGQPGIGKSALIERFAEELSDAIVLSGRCHERESVPFKAFDGIADALARYLGALPKDEAAALVPPDVHLVAQLFPVLGGVPGIERGPAALGDPRELRARAFVALRELVTRIAAQKPLCIAIDDLQWGDRDSAKLLAQLVSPPHAPALLLLLCHRDEESPVLRDTLSMVVAAHTVDLAIEPLPQDDARCLAAHLLGDDAASEAARGIADCGEGHPLFIAELARAQRDTDRAATLMDILWQRVSDLPEPARQLLETVAVAGQPLPSALCFEAAGVERDVDVLRALRAERLLRIGDDGAINVFHDRIRDTILARADENKTRPCHLALAQSLESRADCDLEVVAHHFDAAGEHEKAGRYAGRAADAAMHALAFDRAAALYRMAIDRSSAPDRAIYEKLADALLHAGSTAAAGQAYVAAAERSEGGHAVTLLGRAGEHLLSAGELASGYEALERSLRAVGEALPPTIGASVEEGVGHLMRLRSSRFHFHETNEACISADELLRLDMLCCAMWGCGYISIAFAFGIGMRFCRQSLEAGEPRRAAVGLTWASMGLAAQQPSFPAVIDEVLDVAEQTAQRLSDPNLRALAMRMRGQAHFLFGNFEKARDLCASTASLIAYQCRGMSVHRRWALVFQATSQVRLGELADAQQVADALLVDAVERGDPVVERLTCVAALVHLSLAADDPDGAQSYLERMRLEDRCGNLILGGDATAARAMYVDCPREAVAVWRSRWAQIHEEGLLMQPLFHVMAVHSLAAALLTKPESERDIQEAAELVQSLAAHAFPYARAVRASLQACMALREGRDNEAADLWLQAAEEHAEVGARPEEAACRYRHAELVGGKDAAETMLRSVGIVRPERWVVTTVPRIEDLRRAAPAS